MQDCPVLNELARQVKKFGSQAALADYCGISRQYLCDILAGRRGISPIIAGKFGWEKHGVWKRKPHFVMEAWGTNDIRADGTQTLTRWKRGDEKPTLKTIKPRKGRRK